MARSSEVLLTEQELVPCLFVTGAAVDVSTGCVRLVIWNHVPGLGSTVEEQRIVARLAMSQAVAHDLYHQLKSVLLKGVH